MKTDEILHQTFSSHEHLTPDADLTLDAIRHRVRTRHRSRAAIAGVVAVVVAVAVGASFLPRAHDAAPSKQESRSVAPAKKPTAPKLHPVKAPDYVTVAAGWLPPGKSSQVLIGNGFGQQTRGYNVTSGGQSTYVLIGIQPGRALPTSNKRGTPNDLTIGERPAREWSVDDWYYLAITLPGGRIATVDIEGGHNQGKGGDGSAAALAAIGRNVGAHLELNRHDPIKSGFALSYVPPGLAVQSVSSDDQNGTSYTIAPANAHWSDQMPMYATVNEVRGTAAEIPAAGGPPSPQKGVPPMKAGRPVQGHHTFVIAGSNTPMLWIDNVRPSVSISITGGPGVTTLAEVYRIADGLILPH